MPRRKPRTARRVRIGRVSCYFHHGGWHLYYREGGRPVRHRVADSEEDALRIAAQVNGQLATAAPTPFSFSPISIGDLRRKYLAHHEQVLGSSLGTINRYRTATKYLDDFAASIGSGKSAHDLQADAFVAYLRRLRVSPNGHPNSAKRPLRGKGLLFVLDVCRSLYHFASKQRHLPPYAENPFESAGPRQLRVERSDDVFIFDAQSEAAFLRAASDWAFVIHFTLAKTGMRPGELVHLLIEDLNLDQGWLNVCNKPELGWSVKTGRTRAVPLISEVVTVLRCAIQDRTAGPVFVRQRFHPSTSPLPDFDRASLALEAFRRIEQTDDRQLSLSARARIYRGIWRDAGALRADAVRNSFIRTAKQIGLHATCPKSWRHTFATLLQDANVDPLIRQLTLGHKPIDVSQGALGMTGVYTHTRRETQLREIRRAMELWPQSLGIARKRTSGLVIR